MDRASDSGSEGWGFESLPVYQKRRYPNGYLLFWYSGRKGLEPISMQMSSGHLQPPVQKLVATLSFIPTGNETANRVPSGVTPNMASSILAHRKKRTRIIQCNSPVDCCSIPARWNRHLSCRPFPDGNANESLPVCDPLISTSSTDSCIDFHLPFNKWLFDTNSVF